MQSAVVAMALQRWLDLGYTCSDDAKRDLGVRFMAAVMEYGFCSLLIERIVVENSDANA